MSKTVLANVDGWTPCIDSITQELGIMVSVVFGRVWRYCQGERGVCNASLEKIATELNVSYNTVRTHINTLVEHGYLADLTPTLRNHPHTYADTGKAGLVLSITAAPQKLRSDSSSEFEECAPQNLAMKKEVKRVKKDSRRSPQPPPPPDEHPSAPNSDIQAVAHLEQVFSEARGVPPPDWTRPKEAQKTWRTPCRTMLNLCHGDVDRAEAELRATIRDMKRDKLTFTKPIQVLECFTSRLADQSAPAPTARPAAVWS